MMIAIIDRTNEIGTMVIIFANILSTTEPRIEMQN